MTVFANIFDYVNFFNIFFGKGILKVKDNNGEYHKKNAMSLIGNIKSKKLQSGTRKSINYVRAKTFGLHKIPIHGH